jgi:hypothetical protein
MAYTGADCRQAGGSARRALRPVAPTAARQGGLRSAPGVDTRSADSPAASAQATNVWPTTSRSVGIAAFASSGLPKPSTGTVKSMTRGSSPARVPATQSTAFTVPDGRAILGTQLQNDADHSSPLRDEPLRRGLGPPSETARQRLLHLPAGRYACGCSRFLHQSADALIRWRPPWR